MMRRAGCDVRRVCCVMGFWVLMVGHAVAQDVTTPPDTLAQRVKVAPDSLVQTQPAPDSLVKTPVTPVGALWRSAVVPGWGQWKNGQAYKIPFIYGGLGALIGLAVYNQGKATTADEANLYFRDPEMYAAFEASYNSYLPSTPTDSQLRTVRDGHLRNRDLSIIFTTLVYALNLLDAYVNAHLLTFDVGEDLTVAVRLRF